MRYPSAQYLKAYSKQSWMVCTYNTHRYMNPEDPRMQTPHGMIYEVLETWKSDSVICLTSNLQNAIGFSELKIIRSAKTFYIYHLSAFRKSACPVAQTVYSETVSRLQCWGRKDTSVATSPTSCSRSTLNLPMEVTHKVYTPELC